MEGVAKESLTATMGKGDRYGLKDDDGTDLGTVTYSPGAKTPSVVDEPVFVKWVTENYPGEVTTSTVTTTTVRPAFVAKVLQWTKDNGVAVTPDGEEIPGVDLHQGKPYVIVKPTDEAKERARAALGASLPELTAGGE